MTLPINNPTNANSSLFPGQAAPTVPAGQPTNVPTAVPVPTMPPDSMAVATQVPQVPVGAQAATGQGLGALLTPIFSLLGKMFTGIADFFKRLFAPGGAAPQQPGAVAQVPGAPVPGVQTTVPAAPVTTPPVVATPVTPAPTPVVATPVTPAPTPPTPVVATPVTPAPATPTTPTPVVVPPTTEGQPPVVTVPVTPTAPEATTPAPTPVTPAPVVTTPPVVTPGTQYQATPLTAEELKMCQEQGIAATPENFKAFITEAQALEAQNALGPGTTETDSVNELQQLLAGWGYAVTPNGQFDQATADAVVKFKRDNGIAATYTMADGTPGVHPFVDDATKAAMLKKFEATPPAPTPAPTTVTPAPTPTPVVTPPVTPGQPPVVTVPADGTAPVTTPAPVTPTPVVTTPGTQYQAAPLTAEETQMAQQQGILATRENFDVFIKEAQALEAQNAMGPGSTERDAVMELQQLLAGWGYPVAATGAFDQATADAVIKFKRDNGVASAYKMADGTPGVHPFIDDATKAAMLKKLETAPAAPAPVQTAVPVTPTPAPVVTPPVTTGQPPVVSVPVNTAPTIPATPAPTVPPVVTPGTQYQAAPLSADEARIAAEQGILATRENFDAFMAEAQAIEAKAALGPGSTAQDEVLELQQLLAGWGYPVQATGQFDNATADALVKFKRDNGIAATYRLADGTPAVHPFVDDATKAVMIKKLGG